MPHWTALVTVRAILFYFHTGVSTAEARSK
jgi:hypothetical protein